MKGYFSKNWKSISRIEAFNSYFCGYLPNKETVSGDRIKFLIRFMKRARCNVIVPEEIDNNGKYFIESSDLEGRNGEIKFTVRRA